MSVTTKAHSRESGPLFQVHSTRPDLRPLSHWKKAFAGAYAALSGSLAHSEPREPLSWLDVGGSTHLEVEDVFRALKQIYAIDHEKHVRAWLERHPGAREVLFLAPEAITEFFPAPRLRLDLRQDPESMSASKLAIYIQTDLEPETAVEHFTDFDATHGDWLHGLTEGNLLFNIESK